MWESIVGIFSDLALVEALVVGLIVMLYNLFGSAVYTLLSMALKLVGEESKAGKYLLKAQKALDAIIGNPKHDKE